MYVCVVTCVFVPRETKGQAWVSFLRSIYYLMFLNRVSHWTGTSDLSKPRGTLSLPLGLHICATKPCCVAWVLGTEPRSLCSHG